MANYKFYLIKGTNGIAIADSYRRATMMKKYLLQSAYFGFDAYAEAEQAAIDHLMNIVPYYITIPDCIKVNTVITKNGLYRDYEAMNKNKV